MSDSVNLECLVAIFKTHLFFLFFLAETDLPQYKRISMNNICHEATFTYMIAH